MTQDISRAVLITGCSSGIGRATAIQLADAGWPVYATARRPGSIANLEARGCHTLTLDVTDEHAVRAAVATIVEREGAVGVLVNNAGYSQSGAVEEVPLENVRRQLETNLVGPAHLIQRALPGMRRQGWGKIVNVSSMGGKMTLPGAGYYHASKHALEALSDALRFEVEQFGIDVIVIEPGLIRTQYAEAAVDAMDEVLDNETVDDGPYDRFNRAVARITREGYEQGPLIRFGGEPTDVAAVIERAISSNRPKARYPVTLSAPIMMGLRRWLPDGLWDAFLRTQYPQPGAGESR